MKYEINLKTVIKDRNGKIISEHEQKCNTFVKNFLLLLNAAFRYSYSTVVDTGGTARNAGAEYCYHVYAFSSYTVCGSGGWTPSAGEGDDTFGIVVGTGNTPVTADDYNLASKIAHGTDAGQLSYGAVTLDDPVIIDNTVKQQIMRSFTNNSGADITVNEIGLIVKINYRNYLVMVIRDVITPKTVPAGGSLDIGIVLKTVA